MKKLFLVICIFLFAVSFKAQQDPQYNLYQFNQMIINPAYAGAKDGLSATASNRQQWVGFDGAPKTTCFSIHAPVIKKNVGVGLTFVNDIMGARNATGIYANVAYILKFNQKLKLSLGLNAGYNRYLFNFSKVNFDATETANTFTQNQIINALDVNAGLFLRSDNFFIGLSSTHLNTPKLYTYQSAASQDITYRLRAHVFLTAGYSFKINDNAIVAPTVLIKQINGITGADINLNFFIYKKLWLGAFYRAGYGPGALLQFHINQNFRIGYSYDTGLRDARRLGGSHELMIGFDLKKDKSKMVNPKFL